MRGPATKTPAGTVILSGMKRFGPLLVVLLVVGSCTDPAPEPRPDPDPALTETQAGSPQAGSSQPGIPTPAQAGRTIPLQVWFLSQSRGEPVLKLHHVHAPPTKAVGRAALEHLLAGVPNELKEQDRKAWSAVPEGTELLGLAIEDGTATVDFNEEFGNTGLGTSYDGIQIDQVTWTLTQFPSVKRVRYLIDGEVPEEGIGGHGIIVDKPATRKNSEWWLPPIVVESPYPGEKVEPPIEISGIANVFEATVSYRLRGLHQGFTTATCGTGCYGSFTDQVPLHVKARTDVILDVFESSAEDGRPLHTVTVPFTLLP